MQFQVIGFEEADIMLELMHKHPDFSITELRIWVHLERGLKSREIANLLGRSIRTIENHRYRIRKKRKISKVKFRPPTRE